jgi:sulfide:quinone oxidoreductase
MNIKQLTQNISVSGQIKHSDMMSLAKLGFKTVINNRPDREIPFQPRSKTLAARAKRAGISYLYLPVISGGITQKNVDDFAVLLAKAQGPVFAFCRTGTRSANLWAMANPDHLPSDDITDIGAKAGYTL